MAKYLVLWELDTTKLPTEPKQRQQLSFGLQNMVKQQIKEGKTSEWGAFVGEAKGCAIFEGTELDVSKQLDIYFPYAKFDLKQLLSIDQVTEVAKAIKV